MHTRTLSVLLALTCAGAAAQAAPTGHADSYMLLRAGDTVTMLQGTVHDLKHDIDHVQQQRQSPHERLVWFRLDGREYVIRDPATVAQVEAIYRPVEDLGKEMGKVGSKQGEIGSKQGE